MPKLKASAKSPANIAFIKYWGKTNPKTRVPENNSISMCLSNLFSVCTVEFNPELKKDQVDFIGEKVVKPREIDRIIKVLDRVRALAKTKHRAKLVTKNNFPKATGIASSASGLSVVTLAAVKALGLNLSLKELSKLARLASGTACRSIPDGFVEWKKGTSEANSFSVQLHPPDYWQIVDVVAIVTKKMKKISSTKGHSLANTSPFQVARQKDMGKKIRNIKRAMKKKDFTSFGQILETEALNMHAICLTSKPPILYWEGTTMTIMRKIQEWRAEGLESYFTIDAGPTVHVIAHKKDAKKVVNKLSRISGIDKIVVNEPSIGARETKSHLF